MKKNIKSLNQFIDEQFGVKGTKKRDKFEEGYNDFILKKIKSKKQYYNNQLNKL